MFMEFDKPILLSFSLDYETQRYCISEQKLHSNLVTKTKTIFRVSHDVFSEINQTFTIKYIIHTRIRCTRS